MSKKGAGGEGESVVGIGKKRKKSGWSHYYHHQLSSSEVQEEIRHVFKIALPIMVTNALSMGLQVSQCLIMKKQKRCWW